MVFVISELENERGLVKSTIFRIMNEKMALVMIEIRAAAICRPFSTYSFWKISLHSSWIDESPKFSRLLLQKQVFSVEFDVVLATVKVILGTPSQLVELTLMKILQSDTSVEHTAMKTTMIIIATVIRINRLQELTSILSQLISSGSLTFSDRTLSSYSSLKTYLFPSSGMQQLHIALEHSWSPLLNMK